MFICFTLHSCSWKGLPCQDVGNVTATVTDMGICHTITFDESSIDHAGEYQLLLFNFISDESRIYQEKGVSSDMRIISLSAFCMIPLELYPPWVKSLEMYSGIDCQ